MSLMNKPHEDFFTTIKPFVNKVYTDILGNVIAHKQGQGKRLMLIAHHDVISLMVTYIDDNGFLYVKPSGGIDSSILPARKLIIRHEGNSVIGIIGKKPVHLMGNDANNTKVNYEDIWIDIGANSLEEAAELVSIGDYAYFCTESEELPNDIITGSYLDDIAGLKVLLNLAEQLHKKNLPWDIYFVASNYEEIGMRGAHVAANAIHPAVCICIDVTHATDYPSMNIIRYGDIKLGEGCALAKGPNVYPKLFDALKNAATKNKIPYQIEVSPYPTGTDANVIQLADKGIKTALVSIPCRYMHTPHEMCSKNDIAAAASIIYSFLQTDM